MTTTTTPVARNPLNTFTWLVKREFWEYRGAFFWAPLIIAAVMLAIVALVLLTVELQAHQHGINLSGMNLSRIAQNMSAGDVAKMNAGIDIGLLGMGAPIGITLAFVVFFYTLGALYNDRADRSVLFWKSLPISDTQTVLAKVVAASVLAPTIAVVAMIALHFGFLILLSLYAALHGINPLLLWSPGHLLALWSTLVLMIPVNALWALPSIGWLLLCSSFARSKPFLWAVMLPIVVGVISSIVHVMQSLSVPSGWYWKNVVGRLLFSLFPFGWITHVNVSGDQLSLGIGHEDEGIEVLNRLLSLDTISGMLAQPNLWIGAAAGAAMIAAAIYFRRARLESYA